MIESSTVWYHHSPPTCLQSRNKWQSCSVLWIPRCSHGSVHIIYETLFAFSSFSGCFHKFSISQEQTRAESWSLSARESKGKINFNFCPRRCVYREFKRKQKRSHRARRALWVRWRGWVRVPLAGQPPDITHGRVSNRAARRRRRKIIDEINATEDETKARERTQPKAKTLPFRAITIFPPDIAFEKRRQGNEANIFIRTLLEYFNASERKAALRCVYYLRTWGLNAFGGIGRREIYRQWQQPMPIWLAVIVLLAEFFSTRNIYESIFPSTISPLHSVWAIDWITPSIGPGERKSVFRRESLASFGFNTVDSAKSFRRGTPELSMCF